MSDNLIDLLDFLIRPENVPRLFDLIRFKDRQFAPAFYYGLRDTLVAKDLEQATRIAYKVTTTLIINN